MVGQCGTEGAWVTVGLDSVSGKWVLEVGSIFMVSVGLGVDLC